MAARPLIHGGVDTLGDPVRAAARGVVRVLAVSAGSCVGRRSL